MRLVIQRVLSASVTIGDQEVAQIKKGFLVLIGIHREDNSSVISVLIEQLLKIRLFADSEGKMNLSIKDVEGEILLVSQFTLYGKMQKGTRPGFSEAASGSQALTLYGEFLSKLQSKFDAVQTGVFAADMQVALVNDGPVTMILDSSNKKPS